MQMGIFVFSILNIPQLIDRKLRNYKNPHQQTKKDYCMYQGIKFGEVSRFFEVFILGLIREQK